MRPTLIAPALLTLVLFGCATVTPTLPPQDCAAFCAEQERMLCAESTCLESCTFMRDIVQSAPREECATATDELMACLVAFGEVCGAPEACRPEADVHGRCWNLACTPDPSVCGAP